MFMTTIGVDYRDKLVKIEGRDIKLQIWDTAGQERFRSLTSNFFGRADGFAVCFDVGARASFNHVRQWLDDVEKNKKGPSSWPSSAASATSPLKNDRLHV